MDVAGHVGAEIGQRRYQQRERGPLARGFFRLGGGILHDEAADHLDDFVRHVHHQDRQQDGNHRGEGGVLLGEHVVGQIAHRQGVS